MKNKILNEKIELSNIYIKLGSISYIQSNKNNDIINPIKKQKKRKKSYSDDELDESKKII